MAKGKMGEARGGGDGREEKKRKAISPVESVFASGLSYNH